MNAETEEDTTDEKSFEESLIVNCDCLVKRYDKHYPETFRFAHISMEKYMAQTGGSDEFSIYHSRIQAHAMLSRASIQYLLDCIPASPLSRDSERSVDESTLCGKYPLCKYAALNWIFHLEKSAVRSLGDTEELHHHELALIIQYELALVIQRYSLCQKSYPLG